MDAEIIVTLTGTDETFAQTIHARQSFISDEILWDMKFVDILAKLPDGGDRLTIGYFIRLFLLPNLDRAISTEM
jgi:inward rectifier potassium channel